MGKVKGPVSVAGYEVAMDDVVPDDVAILDEMVLPDELAALIELVVLMTGVLLPDVELLNAEDVVAEELDADT